MPLCCCCGKSEKVAPMEDGLAKMESTVLSKMESDYFFMQETGISTLTFMKAEAVEAFETTLKERFGQVLLANPWLAGRFVRHKDKTVHMEWPADVGWGDVEKEEGSLRKELLGELFQDYREKMKEGVSLKTGYKDISTLLKDVQPVVKSGIEMLENNDRITRLSLLRTTEPEKVICFMLSISHVAVDGHDYYAILDMLGTGKVVTLNPMRKMDYHSNNCSGEKEGKWQWSTGLMTNMTGTMMTGAKPRAVAYYIDEDKVKKEKEKYMKERKGDSGSDPDFVSMNDVLTSSIANSMTHKSRRTYMLMAANWRGRHEGIVDTDAGNYEGCIVLDRHGYQKPENIRKTLTHRNEKGAFIRQPNPVSNVVEPLPGCWGTHRSRISMMTSWASFPFSIEFDGCEQLFHIPYYNFSEVEQGLPFDLFFVFRPKPGKFGVLVFAKRFKEDTACKAEDSVLGEKIEI